MGALAGKRAIVTGGASGIGRAAVELFAAEGAAVVIADVNVAAATFLAEAITRAGGRAMAVECDVTRSADCRRAVEAAVGSFGGLDILFNNAGIICRADVVETTEEEWAHVMAVNVTSVFLMSKHAIPVLARAGAARSSTRAPVGASGAASAHRATARRRARWSTSRARWPSTTGPRGSA